MAAKPSGTATGIEYVRINVDCGSAVVLSAFVWALSAPDQYPTLTVHGSNRTEFWLDTSATVTTGPNGAAVGGVFEANQHALAFDADPLWVLSWETGGSAWTPTAVEAGTADVYQSRLRAGPRYSRLFADGRTETLDYTGFAGAGHRWPAVDLTPPAYRYYALTLSMGRRSATATDRYVLELQQWQLIVEAPAAATLSDAGEATLYGLRGLTTTQGPFLVDVTLSKSLPTNAPPFGFLELWTSYRTRGYYAQGKEWSAASFPSDVGFQGNTTRRALVTLPEILVPRRALIRTRNNAITTVPYVWCFVRQRTLRPVGEHAMIVHRLVDTDRGSANRGLAPPDWINGRDTMRFLLALGSSRIPGECQFICLYTDSSVLVDVVDVPGSSIPELCFVLPTGEVLDFLMYDETISLPREVGHDEWAGIYATVRVQYQDDRDPKRARVGAGV